MVKKSALKYSPIFGTANVIMLDVNGVKNDEIDVVKRIKILLFSSINCSFNKFI